MSEGSYEARFGGLGRLFGRKALERLAGARVCIVGIGGVGSWAAEALARSGIGNLTLIDLDEVCVTNTNRQVHALEGTVGRSKVSVMAERIARIHPGCEVGARELFFTPGTVETCLEGGYDAVIDAIDSLTHKALLVARCRERGLAVVTCGGAGGKRDPARVRVKDLAAATNDRLLKMLRKRLRAEYVFPREENVPFGVEAVYSEENAVYPWSDGRVCEEVEPGSDLGLNCDAGLGTAAFVTGAFGFAAAGWVVRRIAFGEE